MWKYLGWPVAMAIMTYAYVLHLQSQRHRADLRAELNESQQLVAQVSNRLTLVEAQFSTFKLVQEREAKERQQRDKELAAAATAAARAPEPNNEKRRPSAPALNSAKTAPREPDERTPPQQQAADQNAGPGRSIGAGVKSLLNRLRGGSNNSKPDE